MPQYRRCRLQGGSYFFTLVTHQRRPFLCDEPARRLLREVMSACFSRWPTRMEAVVLLPDHLHVIWSLPADDSDYPARWGWLKKEFSKRWLAGGQAAGPIAAARQRERRSGVWQPRYWEHSIRDQRDLERHLDYVHYNPVKHGLVTRVADWPWSSFHRWVRAGAYDEGWGGSTMEFADIEEGVGDDP